MITILIKVVTCYEELPLTNSCNFQCGGHTKLREKLYLHLQNTHGH